MAARQVSRQRAQRRMARGLFLGSASYSNEIHFTSPRQHTLFQILPVLRHLDPVLAESLIGSHNQVAAAVRRYPNGLETMNDETKAEAERRRANGATCGGGGYMLAGNPADFDRQRGLINATRSGDFEPSIEDAIQKWEEDASAATRNYAPKEYWPSTGAFRMLFYQAGRRLGPEAIKLLERIPDDDIRLFANIELAAGLAGVPGASITRMKVSTVPQCEVPMAALSDVRNVSSDPLQIFVGAARAVMSGIHFGLQGFVPHVTSNGR